MRQLPRSGVFAETRPHIVKLAREVKYHLEHRYKLIRALHQMRNASFKLHPDRPPDRVL